MSDNTGRAKFSLSEGRIEIEGSENFVATQLEKLEPMFNRIFEVRDKPHLDKTTNTEPAADSGKAVGLDAYQNLFALADGKVQILKSLPGSGKAPKAFNAALLLAFANELQGSKTTTFEEIKNICVSHACYDAANFAKIFKTASGKEAFTTSGTSSASLTHPGRNKARALAETLNK